MATWWKYSPYYDTSVYFPNTPNRPTPDPLLNSDWVTQVKNQGWGLIPIWVGLQPPCTVDGITHSQIDPATVASQGTAEADTAAGEAVTLGLPKAVIYKDLENYDTSNSQCIAAVTSYTGAWVSELHRLGYSAGVYTNPLPAKQDISTALPVPDEIWVAKYDNKTTIWHLGTLDDGPWPSNQRMQQFAGNITKSYGGLSVGIDRNIDDAPAAGSQGVKTYSSWTVSVVDYPDNPPNTGMFGINGGYLHQLDATNNTIPPILVGIYCVQCNPYSEDVGFYWNGQDFVSLNDATNGSAIPFGANNIGQISGYVYPYYDDLPGPVQGFIYNILTGATIFLNAPGAAGSLIYKV